MEGQAGDRQPGGRHPDFQISPGVTGYVVETVEGAAFRIRHLLNNPELIGRMGAAGASTCAGISC